MVRAHIHETVVAKTQVIQRLKADKHCFSHQSLFYIYDLGHLLYAGSCSLLIDLPIDAKFAIFKIGFTIRILQNTLGKYADLSRLYTTYLMVVMATK